MYVYAIDNQYFGQPEELTSEEAAQRNARFVLMKLQARYIGLLTLVEKYGDGLRWVRMDAPKPEVKILQFTVRSEDAA